MKSDRRHFKRPREPLARSDTESESIAQLTYQSEQWRGLPVGYLTGSNPPLGRPPTGFAELDVGEFIRHLFGGPVDVECDVGLMLDELVSSELERTWLSDEEVRLNKYRAMDSKRFRLCQN